MSDSESSSIDDLTELTSIIKDNQKSSSTTTQHNEKITTKLPESKNYTSLEKIVFNKKDDLYSNLSAIAADGDQKTTSSTTISESVSNKIPRKPVWDDEDNNECIGNILQNKKRRTYSHLKQDKSYNEFLRDKFTYLQPQPKWADLDQDKKSDSENEEELLKTIGFKSKSNSLLPNTIQIKRLKDLNRSTYAESNITSIQFHPTSTVGLVAGLFGVVSLYSIDGYKNEKLHNINFDNFLVKCAKIHPTGTEVIVGGNKKYFYSIDLMTGKETRIFLPDNITKLSLFEISKCGKYICAAGRFGEIHLIDAKSKELIHTYKQEDLCTDLRILSDSSKIISHSNSSQVTIFDIRKQKIEHIFIDDGCISGKTIDISPNMRIIATGSNEGVVNIYDYNKVFTTKAPEPEKIIYNLTTSISVTKFNHSSEILGICSNTVAGACKLIHFPTGTVYSNFPGQNANIGHVTTLNFSPNDGFMALGNRKSEVPLFRLKHFKNY